MARVGYQGAPDVAPSYEGAPFQHVNVSPASFGGGIASGVEGLGQGLMDAAKFYGDVAAENGTNNTLEQVGRLLHGDPNKMVPGADGKMQPDTGYFGKRGADAMSSRADVDAEIQQIIQQNREALQGPLAKRQYDNAMGRQRVQWQTQIGTYADEQQRVWAVDTNNTAATLALNDVGRYAADDAAILPYQEKVRQAYVRNAQLKGENADGALLSADQTVALTRIRSLLENDPTGASRVFEANADKLRSLPNYDGIAHQIRTATINATMGPAVDAMVDQAFGDALGQVGPPTGGAAGVGDSASYLAAVRGRENAHGAPDARNPRSSAMGNAQFIAKTWYDPEHPERSVMGQPEFHDVIAGKTPAEILALRANPEISDRATLTYGRLNATALRAYGDPVNTTTVGLAHGFGAGGAHALLISDPKTPVRDVLPGVIAANPDLRNKTVGDVIQSFRQRFGDRGVSTGTYPSPADALAANRASILDRAEARAREIFPNYPDAQQQFVNHVDRKIDRVISQQHAEYEVDAHIVQSAMAQANPTTVQELEALGPQVKAAWTSLQVNLPSTAYSIERMLDANANGKATTLGTGFKTYLDRVLAPPGSPSGIANASALWPFVGKGNDAMLTNTGANQLTELLTLRRTPEGVAAASQMRGFINKMHADLTYSNAGTGVYDVNGEKIFSRFMAQALPAMIQAQKSGKLPQVLNPQSPDYLGNIAQTFARSPAEKMDQQLKDRASSYGGTPFRLSPMELNARLDTLDNDDQRREAIVAAYQRHDITRDMASRMLVSRRLAVAPGEVSMAEPSPVPLAR